MVEASQIQEHMEVVGSDDQHVGTVDRVESDIIKLTKNDQAAHGDHHTIPLSMVDSIEAGKLKLNATAAQAKQQWHDIDAGGGNADIVAAGGGN